MNPPRIYISHCSTNINGITERPGRNPKNRALQGSDKRERLYPEGIVVEGLPIDPD